MKSATFSICMVALALAGFAAPHGAWGAILVSDGTATGNRDNFTGTAGTRFTVGGSNVVINALGYQDPGGDGLAMNHRVGLWRVSDQAQLALVTVLAGTGGTFEDVWRYELIGSNITLNAGETYILGAEVITGSGDSWTDTSTGPSKFSLGAGIVDANPTNHYLLFSFGYPTGDGTETDLRWSVANATLLTIPEPSALAMACLGAVGIGMTWCSRRRGK